MIMGLTKIQIKCPWKGDVEMSIAIEIESDDSLISRGNDQERKKERKISTKKGCCGLRSVYRRIKAIKATPIKRNLKKNNGSKKKLRGKFQKAGIPLS